jgi:hypothetical protein
MSVGSGDVPPPPPGALPPSRSSKDVNDRGHSSQSKLPVVDLRTKRDGKVIIIDAGASADDALITIERAAGDSGVSKASPPTGAGDPIAKHIREPLSPKAHHKSGSRDSSKQSQVLTYTFMRIVTIAQTNSIRNQATAAAAARASRLTSRANHRAKTKRGKAIRRRRREVQVQANRVRGHTAK